MRDETKTFSAWTFRCVTCESICGNMARRTTAKHHHDESSESENETEPAKIFHRRLSTNVKSSVSIGDILRSLILTLVCVRLSKHIIKGSDLHRYYSCLRTTHTCRLVNMSKRLWAYTELTSRARSTGMISLLSRTAPPSLSLFHSKAIALCIVGMMSFIQGSVAIQSRILPVGKRFFFYL